MNRIPPWVILVGALAAIALIGALTTNNSPPRALAAGSAKPNGALALYLWLERSGYTVDRLSGISADVSTADTRRTVFVIASGSDLSASRARALLAWVRRGGSLVIATKGMTGLALLDAIHASIVPAAPDPVAVRQPLLLAPPVAALSGTAPFVIGSHLGTSVAESDVGIALVRLSWGRGIVWLLTAPDLLDNSHIARADNRRLALNLAGEPGRHVTFGEFSPDVHGAVTDWLTQTAWGAAVLLLVILLLLYRGLAGWRLGPAVTLPTDQYRPASEYVISLAGLLRRGHKRQEVLEVYQQRLRRALRRRYGDERRANPLATSRDRAEVLLRTPGSLKENDLIRQVREIVECEEAVRSRRD